MRAGVLLASVVAVVVAVLVSLHKHEPTVVGYNGVPPAGFVGTVRPHRPVCTGLPEGSSAPDHVRVTLATNGQAPEPVRATVPGVGIGATVSGWREGVVDLPLPAGAYSKDGGFCVQNLGTRPLLIAGTPGGGVTVKRKQQPYAVSLQVIDTDRPRWSGDVGAILDRVGFGRAGAGGTATGYLAVGFLLLAMLSGLGAAWRWVR